MIKEQSIYRVGGFYQSGKNVFHQLGADTIQEAIEKTLAADSRLIRVTHVSLICDGES